MSTSLPVVEPETLEESRVRAQRLWCTVVHDDPINTMSYVTWVFHSYFGFSLPVAEARMMQVHTAGRAVVSRGPASAWRSMSRRCTATVCAPPIEPMGEDADASADDSSGGR